jgi:hypothetical protein
MVQQLEPRHCRHCESFVVVEQFAATAASPAPPDVPPAPTGATEQLLSHAPSSGGWVSDAEHAAARRRQVAT